MALTKIGLHPSRGSPQRNFLIKLLWIHLGLVLSIGHVPIACSYHTVHDHYPLRDSAFSRQTTQSSLNSSRWLSRDRVLAHPRPNDLRNMKFASGESTSEQIFGVFLFQSTRQILHSSLKNHVPLAKQISLLLPNLIRRVNENSYQLRELLPANEIPWERKYPPPTPPLAAEKVHTGEKE